MRGPTLVIATAIVLAVCAPVAGAADQNQQLLNQRALEAKRKLQAAEAAHGAQRQKLMKEHMSAMPFSLSARNARISPVLAANLATNSLLFTFPHRSKNDLGWKTAQPRDISEVQVLADDRVLLTQSVLPDFQVIGLGEPDVSDMHRSWEHAAELTQQARRQVLVEDQLHFTAEAIKLLRSRSAA